MSRHAWQRSPEEFAAHLAQVTPWLIEQLQDDRQRWSPCAPGEILAKLPEQPPSSPEPLSTVLEDLQSIIEPGLVRWNAPGWFAWFPSNAHPDAILGDLLASATAQQGMLWASSPACTELETRMLEWLRIALGLPENFREGGSGGGVIQDTASSGVLACMVAARDRTTAGLATSKGGDACGGLIAYASEQSHSSVLKAAGICGIGRDNLRLIPTDEAYQLDTEALARTMEQDAQAGNRPCFCCATVGTTGCGAIDPVGRIADVCGDHNCWLHVDAAWAGTAALVPEFRTALTAGSDRADSWSFNPHKWMGAAFDCSCLWIADRSHLIASMSIDPEYLSNSASRSGDVIDYRDWHVQLGRRFRALKLWVLLRCTGVDVLADMVRAHVGFAQQIENAVEGISELLLAAPRTLSLLCIRHTEGDDATQNLIDRINQSDRFAVTHCRLDGHLVMRVAVGTLAVDQETVDAFIAAIRT